MGDIGYRDLDFEIARRRPITLLLRPDGLLDHSSDFFILIAENHHRIIGISLQPGCQNILLAHIKTLVEIRTCDHFGNKLLVGKSFDGGRFRHSRKIGRFVVRRRNRHRNGIRRGFRRRDFKRNRRGDIRLVIVASKTEKRRPAKKPAE